MYNVTSRVSAAILASLLLIGAAPRQSAAQTVRQANSVKDKDYGCIAPLVCGTLNDETAAVDLSTATAASISPPLALGSAALRVGFAAPVPTGSRVSVMVSFTSGSALSLGLVNNTSIKTYAANGSSSVQTANLGTLLNLSTMTSNVMTVEFMSTGSFQELELRTGSAVAANIGYSVQLYHVMAAIAAPLPVELVAFRGKARTRAVELSWETASERQSAYFQVERAASALGEFKPVGKVAAIGNSTGTTAYQFVDAQPLALGYYRLRQVDQDGTAAYSPVVAVESVLALALQAYPNPTTGTLKLQGPVGTQFTLVNKLGQVVQQGSIAQNQPQELSLHGQPDGVYFLREQATGHTLKVVKAVGSPLQ